MTVKKKMKCKALKLYRYWGTHGRGDRDSEIEDIRNLEIFFSDELLPGEYQYQYSFVIDNGPLTYHGKLVNIDWYLKVELIIPWGIDKEYATEFIVERSKPHNKNFKKYDFPTQVLSHQIDADEPEWGGIMRVLFFLVPGIILLAYGYKNENDLSSLVGWVFSVCGVIFLSGYLLEIFARSKLGKVQLKLQPVRLTPSQICQIDLSFTAKSDFKINVISIELIGTEESTRSSGTDEITDNYEFFHQGLLISKSGFVKSDANFSEKIAIEIPENIPPSCALSNNSIKWSVKVQIKGEKGLDWLSTKDITILV